MQPFSIYHWQFTGFLKTFSKIDIGQILYTQLTHEALEMPQSELWCLIKIEGFQQIQMYSVQRREFKYVE